MHAIAGDTRENMSVLETRTGQEFRFVLPGPTVDHAIQALLEALLPTAEPGSQPARWIIASGSLPPGMPHDFYAQLAHAAQQQGTPLALDTSGAALAAALEVGVALVKSSLRELRDLLQRPLNTVQECGDAAFTLVQQGAASTVAVSMASKAPCWPTATAYGTHQRLRCQPPPAPRGGRLLLAALVWALERGDTPPEALRWGVAAGAAALLSPGTPGPGRRHPPPARPGARAAGNHCGPLNRPPSASGRGTIAPFFLARARSALKLMTDLSLSAPGAPGTTRLHPQRLRLLAASRTHRTAPRPERSASRLLDGHAMAPADRIFRELPGLLREGDLLVFNDTRVVKARIFGEKASGGKLELLIERVLPAEAGSAGNEVVAHMKVSKAPARQHRAHGRRPPRGRL